MCETLSLPVRAPGQLHQGNSELGTAAGVKGPLQPLGSGSVAGQVPGHGIAPPAPCTDFPVVLSVGSGASEVDQQVPFLCC